MCALLIVPQGGVVRVSVGYSGNRNRNEARGRLLRFDTIDIIILAAAGVAFVILRLASRKSKMEKTQPEIVQSLLNEVSVNSILVEGSGLLRRVKKFRDERWQRNKARISFLEKPLQVILSRTFVAIEDLNQQIAVARKGGSANPYVSDTGNLTELLAKSKSGLEEWMLKNTGGKELPPKYPGLIDGLFR